MEIKEPPVGWALPRFEDVALIGAGNPAPQGSQCFAIDGTPFVRVKDMGQLGASRQIRSTCDRVSDFGAKNLTLVRSGTVLFTKSGASTLLNQRAVLATDSYVVSHIGLAEPSEATSSNWIYYWLKTVDFAKIAHGGNMPSLPISRVKSLRLPLPPLSEQHRIVAKIEELFSELDAGVESLKTARAQLGVYRQALLKKAFEGKLTAKWRGANPDKLEPADVLIARIRKEREARYQQQLVDWKTAVTQWEKNDSKGKKPAKPRQPKPVEPLSDKELAELPELPEGWVWLRLAGTTVEISDGPFGSNLKTSDYVSAGVRVVRLENIGYGAFVGDKESYVSEEKYRSISKHTVYPGDLVFSSFINDAVRATIVPDTIEKAVNKADCFCVRLYGNSMTKEFVGQCFMARYFYKYLESRVHGVGRPRINTTQLGEAPIALCSLPEQREIVRILEEQFTAIEQNEREIDAALQRAEALRQSILKKAFSGKLVPQDPNDEPASVLLERIRAEREAAAKQKPKKRAAKKRRALSS